MFEPENPGLARPVWQVGALCRAIADALQARFNPVAVRGEITGFSRAASGHCYFTLKDRDGQIRCAMFRRAAQQLDFSPRDGELVEVVGKLGVYEARGDLQLIVEDMRRAGQGALFEEFLRLKAKLEAEGLFDGARKRPLAALPRGIGIVTSPGAAALHDVVTALRRRVPHIPVVLVPALVQGAQAPASICEALSKLYLLAQQGRAAEPDLAVDGAPSIDAILLVRGGGSIEDLWAFNDERVARMVVQSPVPLISGVGHETDFTIADFCADLRAPTPTAAAELVAQPREVWLGVLQLLADRLADGVQRQIDQRLQRLDMAAQRLGRPSGLAARQQLQLARLAQRMRHAVLLKLQRLAHDQQALQADLPRKLAQGLQRQDQRLEQLALRLSLLNPQRVLERGYAVLTDDRGRTVADAAGLRTGDALRATLAHGQVDLTVAQPRLL
ncbi:exodeoxyribonuclease VII large subunit [Pulveribacter suum]|uniref:Exodeoxyribonuclease 7 large subunit n=1 Tax=Pulveribacter suum TaxID=2116657 RepID=A0A2P1NLX7_9BURK|nr:exodeoxyribonuclease VII large subunit [Pulveribacter suum]AVP58061.1 exodeoxyribonuclease VII large subunit [Pulveribacter suum]